jgi:hypothetical protein
MYETIMHNRSGIWDHDHEIRTFDQFLSQIGYF